MIKSEKKLNELVLLLNEEDDTIVAEAIELLRQEVPFEGAIALITHIYNRTASTSIRRVIELFMNDIKDQSTVEEVITEIRKKWKPETTSMLVSSCWQSGLNYEKYSLDFAKVFMEADYATSIECFTVIEETVPSITTETKDEIKHLVNKSITVLTAEKRDLAQELLSILDKE